MGALWRFLRDGDALRSLRVVGSPLADLASVVSKFRRLVGNSWEWLLRLSGRDGRAVLGAYRNDMRLSECLPKDLMRQGGYADDT